MKHQPIDADPIDRAAWNALAAAWAKQFSVDARGEHPSLHIYATTMPAGFEAKIFVGEVDAKGLGARMNACSSLATIDHITVKHEPTNGSQHIYKLWCGDESALLRYVNLLLPAPLSVIPHAPSKQASIR